MYLDTRHTIVGSRGSNCSKLCKQLAHICGKGNAESGRVVRAQKLPPFCRARESYAYARLPQTCPLALQAHNEGRVSTPACYT